MSLIFEEKVNQNRELFIKKVRAISSRHKINPNWLMAVMNSETGGSFSPSQKNYAGSGATGLIQFMPSTAKDLGTSTDNLAKMTNVKQLDYVDKYITMQKSNFKIDNIKDFDDLYLMVFYPKAIGKPNDWEFPSYIYSQNKGVDSNGDGVITVKDFKEFIRKKIPRNRLNEFLGKKPYSRYLLYGVLILIIIILIYLIMFKIK